MSVHCCLAIPSARLQAGPLSLVELESVDHKFHRPTSDGGHTHQRSSERKWSIRFCRPDCSSKCLGCVWTRSFDDDWERGPSYLVAPNRLFGPSNPLFSPVNTSEHFFPTTRLADFHLSRRILAPPSLDSCFLTQLVWSLGSGDRGAPVRVIH